MHMVLWQRVDDAVMANIGRVPRCDETELE